MPSRPENGGSPQVTTWSDVIDSALGGFREAAKRLHEVVTETLREVTPIAARFLEQARDALDEGMAPNWKRMTMPQVVDTIELMRDTGWALAWTPPHDVLVEVLAAENLDSRKSVLLNAEPLILIDLRRLVDDVRRPELYDVTRAANEALEAHVSGFYWASQALATNALSTTIQHVYGMGTFKEAREKFQQMVDEEAGLREMRLAAFLMAVVRTIDTWWPGYPTPEHFNRHVSTHFVGGGSYGQVNSLTSLMLLIGFLRETQLAMELVEHDEHAEAPAAGE